MKVLLPLLWLIPLFLRVAALGRTLGPPPDYNEAFDNGTYSYYPERKYVTTTDIKSPEVNYLQWDPRCDDGLYTFMTPRGHSLPRPGPAILDNRGQLIWWHHYDNIYGGEGYNFLVQKYKGQDILTFWLGDDRVRGHGSGYYYLMNSSYQIFQKVNAAAGLTADLHEFVITNDDTALMTIYEIVPGDVTMFRDFDPEHILHDDQPNYIWDGVFQEIDIESGELLFEWRASEHMDITDTYRPVYLMGNMDDPFDWFHINSIQKDELGNYLISARYPHSIIYIDGKTKDTIWQLGGRSNDFMDLSGGNAINFAWQHDARFRPLDSLPGIYTPPPAREGFTTRLLTLFDNAAEDQHYVYGIEYSRALVLELTFPTPGTALADAGAQIDPEARPVATEGTLDNNQVKVLQINGTDPNYIAREVMAYVNPNDVRSSSQGNVQFLGQGPGKDPKILVGYGLSAVYTEFDINGTVLCDVHYGAETSWETGHIQSYRVYKFDWTGNPTWSPQVEIREDENLLYVSWLGSTEVTDWAVQSSKYESDQDTHWRDLVHTPKIDFETQITIPGGLGDARFLRIVALDEHGDALPNGASNIVARGLDIHPMPSFQGGFRDESPTSIPSIAAQEEEGWSPMKIFLILLCNVSGLFVLYELYRRWLGWRMGRPSAGAFRWRKGVVAGKWLGEA